MNDDFYRSIETKLQERKVRFKTKNDNHENEQTPSSILNEKPPTPRSILKNSQLKNKKNSEIILNIGHDYITSFDRPYNDNKSFEMDTINDFINTNTQANDDQECSIFIVDSKMPNTENCFCTNLDISDGNDINNPNGTSFHSSLNKGTETNLATFKPDYLKSTHVTDLSNIETAVSKEDEIKSIQAKKDKKFEEMNRNIDEAIREIYRINGIDNQREYDLYMEREKNKNDTVDLLEKYGLLSENTSLNEEDHDFDALTPLTNNHNKKNKGNTSVENSNKNRTFIQKCKKFQNKLNNSYSLNLCVIGTLFILTIILIANFSYLKIFNLEQITQLEAILYFIILVLHLLTVFVAIVLEISFKNECLKLLGKIILLIYDVGLIVYLIIDHLYFLMQYDN